MTKLIIKSDITVIVQGFYKHEHLRNILILRRQGVEVIVSAWSGNISDEDRASLEQTGVVCIETKDPGSVTAYQVNDELKTLNVKRVMKGLSAALAFVKTSHIIKSRMDVYFDIQKFIDSWNEIGRDYVSVNVTSHSPKRFGSYGYLFLISDWIWGLKAEHAKDIFIHDINERDFLLERPKFIKDMLWFTKLGAEQIFSILISGYNFKDFTNFPDATQKETYKKVDASIKNKWGNINVDTINCRSNKYRGMGLTLRWLRYNNSHFRDDSFLTFRVLDLCLFLLGKILNYYRKIPK